MIISTNKQTKNQNYTSNRKLEWRFFYVTILLSIDPEPNKLHTYSFFFFFFSDEFYCIDANRNIFSWFYVHIDTYTCTFTLRTIKKTLKFSMRDFFFFFTLCGLTIVWIDTMNSCYFSFFRLLHLFAMRCEQKFSIDKWNAIRCKHTQWDWFSINLVLARSRLFHLLNALSVDGPFFLFFSV